MDKNDTTLAESISLPASSGSTGSSADPRDQFTFDIVNWDALAALACKLLQVGSSHWGEQISGGYNLVRFLHLRDSQNTTLVARVPLRSEDAMTPEHDSMLSERIESEVATMDYVESQTNIPVPHVYHHNANVEGDVGSPYTLMSKAEGVKLISIWDDMDDDKRRIVLRQVVDILLELWAHRFDKPGVLFKRPGGGKGRDAWCIKPDRSVYANPNYTGSKYRLSTTSYSHAADYWLAYANASLHDICDANFGADKADSYSMEWFCRSLIPALFDPTIDTHGFPLTQGDFHSQNIMVADANSNPRITAIIDWEFSGPKFATSFAQYPFFIVDHPMWQKDNRLCERNIRDQATFDELIREAERHRDPVDGLQLSHLISNSYGVYLFEQVMQDPYFGGIVYPLLFKHIFGDDEDFSTDYYWALMEHGILKKDKELFEMETRAWLEAQEVLRDVAEVGGGLKAQEFKDLVLKHLDRFAEGGGVCEWLASVN